MSNHLQPLAGCSFRVFLKLLLENKGIDPKDVPRALQILGLCALGGAARIPEKKWFEQIVKPLKIQNDPIFVIGHWRSGTTFLHMLMSQDEQFGYSKRPMDNITMDLDSSQEEEYSLENLGLCRFYHGWSFPRSIQKRLYRFYPSWSFPRSIEK
jgi:omega-hydroxy-beta-dihydromenaquinone-9 sulfotransferase